MRHLLKRHPFPVVAFFRHSLVLTYAFPPQVLQPLLPPGLVLDTHGGYAFAAVALVQTERLRPAFLPAVCGQNFFLAGYRVFTRMGSSISARRGLRILRSDADRRLMVLTGNLLTHYQYGYCQALVREQDQQLTVQVTTPGGRADVDVTADLSCTRAALPAGSPFANEKEARRFAGPLPFTFDFERETHSIIAVRGVRQEWHPRPVPVQVRRLAFFDREPFCQAPPVLANAFYLRNVPYRWEKGVRTPVVAA